MSFKTKKNWKSTDHTERLLKILATQGEMIAQEFLAHVPRQRGDYLDFYPAAAFRTFSSAQASA